MGNEEQCWLGIVPQTIPTIRDKWPPTAPQTLISLRLQQEMEETADVPARVGVYQPLDDVEVGLLRLHRRPAAHRAGSLSTVLRKQQVSLEFEINNNELI